MGNTERLRMGEEYTGVAIDPVTQRCRKIEIKRLVEAYTHASREELTEGGIPGGYANRKQTIYIRIAKLTDRRT